MPNPFKAIAKKQAIKKNEAMLKRELDNVLLNISLGSAPLYNHFVKQWKRENIGQQKDYEIAVDIFTGILNGMIATIRSARIHDKIDLSKHFQDIKKLKAVLSKMKAPSSDITVLTNGLFDLIDWIDRAVSEYDRVNQEILKKYSDRMFRMC